MRTLLLGVLFFCALQGMAQRACVSHEYLEQTKNENIRTAENMADAESFVQLHLRNNLSSRIAATVIRIPVVVHVLYNGTTYSVTEAQVRSQIDVLNNDFRKKNSDTTYTPDRFKPFAADVQIEFALATADPKGRSTTGILFKHTSVAAFSMDDKIKFSSLGGDDAWDSKSYLNIWVGNIRTILGYSSVPGSDANKDGVVINTTAFGTINTAAPYHLGRTAVHEVGHWLGLKHIWGDVGCGDDLVDDTPKQSSYTTGCPTGIKISCDNGPLGDMYMNFMDFTNDACLNMFTQGQKQRMRSLFDEGGPRASIVYSKGLNTPWLEESAVVDTEETTATILSLYPNPTSGSVTINFTHDASWMGKTLRIVTINGVVMQTITITSSVQTISVAALKTGLYFIQGENGAKKIRQKLVKL